MAHAKNRLSETNTVLEKKILEKNYLLRLMERIRYMETVIFKACSGDGSNGFNASRRHFSSSCMLVEEDSIEFKCVNETFFGRGQMCLLKYYLLRPTSSSLIPLASSSKHFFLTLSLSDLSLVLDGGWSGLLKGSLQSTAFFLSTSVEDSILSFSSRPSSSSSASDPSTSATSTAVLYTVLLCDMEAPFEDLSLSRSKDHLLMEAILICSHRQPYCDGKKMSSLQNRFEGLSHGLLRSASEPPLIASSIDILGEYQGISCRLISSAFILNLYELPAEKVKRELSLYVDNLLQEVTVERADLLRYAQAEVEQGEEAIRQVRGNVEKERRLQENLFRSIKK